MAQANCVIRDKDGNIIQRSRNLAGIRRYTAHSIIKTLDVSHIGDKLLDGQLSILFNNGDTFQTNFASFAVLCGWVERWRNAHGAPLTIDGVAAGVVGKGNLPNGV